MLLMFFNFNSCISTYSFDFGAGFHITFMWFRSGVCSLSPLTFDLFLLRFSCLGLWECSVSLAILYLTIALCTKWHTQGKAKKNTQNEKKINQTPLYYTMLMHKNPPALFRFLLISLCCWSCAVFLFHFITSCECVFFFVIFFFLFLAKSSCSLGYRYR